MGTVVRRWIRGDDAQSLLEYALLAALVALAAAVALTNLTGGISATFNTLVSKLG